MAKTTLLRACSRMSLEIGKKWFTFEAQEEISLTAKDNVEEEKAKLWERTNLTVDEQVNDAVEMVNNPPEGEAEK